jgi:DNA mismatch endonuclease (patch repair protein)
MSKIKLKRGVAESVLAKILWHRGVRYRLNYRALAGSPDIAITKHKVAVFIDGEFWHGQDWENRKPRLKRNREYWIEKIEENMARDKRNDATLTDAGWSVIRFWEKEIIKDADACANAVIAEISVRVATSHYPDNILKLLNSASTADMASTASTAAVAESSVAYKVSNSLDSK